MRTMSQATSESAAPRGTLIDGGTPVQNVLFILAAAALAVPALVLRLGGIHINIPMDTAI